MVRTAVPLPDPRPHGPASRFDQVGTVIGSDGKWSKALKAAFIQASPADRVKMPQAPPFRDLDHRVAAPDR
jgi:hypothetical protein